MWTSKVMFSKYFEMRIILEVFYSRKYLIEQYLMKLCIRNLLMEKSLTFDVFLSFFFLFWNLVFFTGTCVTDFQVQYSLVEKIYTRTYFEKILKRVSFWTVLQRIIVQNYCLMKAQNLKICIDDLFCFDHPSVKYKCKD